MPGSVAGVVCSCVLRRSNAGVVRNGPQPRLGADGVCRIEVPRSRVPGERLGFLTGRLWSRSLSESGGRFCSALLQSEFDDQTLCLASGLSVSSRSCPRVV